MGLDGSIEETHPGLQLEDDGSEDEDESETEEDRGLGRGAAGSHELEKLTAHLPCKYLQADWGFVGIICFQ